MPLKLPPQKKAPKEGRSFAKGAGGLAAGAGLAAAFWRLHVESATGPVSLSAGDGDLKEKVLPHVPLLTQHPYRPSPWAVNTHLQNILGFTFRGLTLNANYRRQLIIAHDGGTLGLDWFKHCDSWDYAPPETPVLLVLHGINGGSHEGYCKWSCNAAHTRGWRSCALNYRGCNGLPLTSPRGYAASLTHDIHYAITSIKARFPKAPIFAAGYSLGALFLTKYLAEADHGLHASQVASSSTFEPFEGSGLVAAACISSPVCLAGDSSSLAKPWTIAFLYNLAVAIKIREFIQQHRASISVGANFDVDKAMACWTVGAIEDTGVPNTLGFKDRQEYYEEVSSLKYIPHIRTPTLFLNAKDDPFLGVLPVKECASNPNTVLATTTHGGHVAFLQGWMPFGPAWMDYVMLQFMTAVAQHYPATAAAESAAAAHLDAERQRMSHQQQQVVPAPPFPAPELLDQRQHVSIVGPGPPLRDQRNEGQGAPTKWLALDNEDVLGHSGASPVTDQARVSQSRASPATDQAGVGHSGASPAADQAVAPGPPIREQQQHERQGAATKWLALDNEDVVGHSGAPERQHHQHRHQQQQQQQQQEGAGGASHSHSVAEVEECAPHSAHSVSGPSEAAHSTAHSAGGTTEEPRSTAHSVSGPSEAAHSTTHSTGGITEEPHSTAHSVSGSTEEPQDTTSHSVPAAEHHLLGSSGEQPSEDEQPGTSSMAVEREQPEKMSSSMAAEREQPDTSSMAAGDGTELATISSTTTANNSSSSSSSEQAHTALGLSLDTEGSERDTSQQQQQQQQQQGCAAAAAAVAEHTHHMSNAAQIASQQQQQQQQQQSEDWQQQQQEQGHQQLQQQSEGWQQQKQQQQQGEVGGVSCAAVEGHSSERAGLPHQVHALKQERGVTASMHHMHQAVGARGPVQADAVRSRL